MLCLLLFTKINIFVFASAIWTAFFAVPYLALSPVSSFDFERRWGIPGMESSVMILWLAGFVFQACSLPSPVHCTSADCTVSQVAVVFGAFERYVFSIISKALYYCTQYINLNSHFHLLYRALFFFTSTGAVLTAVRKPNIILDGCV